MIEVDNGEKGVQFIDRGDSAKTWREWIAERASRTEHANEIGASREEGGRSVSVTFNKNTSNLDITFYEGGEVLKEAYLPFDKYLELQAYLQNCYDKVVTKSLVEEIANYIQGVLPHFSHSANGDYFEHVTLQCSLNK